MQLIDLLLHQASNESGEVNLVHICVYFIFMPIYVVHRQMFAYCQYTLRDVLGPNRYASQRKVSAGMSVNSSTVAADSDEGSA